MYISEKPLNIKRYYFFLICIFLFFTLYVYRLIDWQILNAKIYKDRAKIGDTYMIKSDAVRGEIFDCNNTGLAVNDTKYKVILDRLLINKNIENEIILETVKLIKNSNNEFIDILPLYVFEDKFFFKENEENKILSFKKTIQVDNNASVDECIETMIQRYKIKNDISNEDKLIICSVRYNMEKEFGLYSRAISYTIAKDIDNNSAILLSENIEKLKGIRIQSYLVRKYINGKIAPHIIGYTGLMSDKEYERLKDNYGMDEKIGKTGIEKVFEDDLRGYKGNKIVKVSPKSNEIIEVSEKSSSVAGNSIFLTISSKIQKVANKSLKKNVEKAFKSGIRDCGCGAVVALDVDDFSVIAAATYPSYDLTKFMENKDYYSKLYNDKHVPLLNRAFQGAYAPGSIFKPFIACASLQENKVSKDETINCSGSFNFYKGYKLRCMGIHRNAKLVYALAKSCNVYFAELGRRLGAELIGTWCEKFGLGIKTGIETIESEGIIAGPSHCEKVGSKWYESGSSQSAIGQSDNMFTPLQLAVATGVIANGGNRYKPHIVKQIMDYNKKNVIKEFKKELIEKIDISEENLNTVKEGMREVVKSGTARDFANYKVNVAAKTGTAQNSGSDHTTFICFAPYEKPKIAIAVVIEHGSLGSVSKNVARDIMDVYFEDIK